LWFRPERRDATGKLTHAGSYIILDGRRQVGVRSDDSGVAQKALADYINAQHGRQIAKGKRDPADIPIIDVINVYVTDKAHEHARPAETARALRRIDAFMEGKSLADINGRLCRDYAKQSGTDTMARRDLELLRAAINHHRREGLLDRMVSVVLPERRPARERWLTRSEAAKLLWTAWRRPKCKQVARFILFALYTGRRASVVSSASFVREPGRNWIDTKGGMLWPPERAKVTNKRNPATAIQPELLAHLRRWERTGRYLVPWGEHSVGRLDRTIAIIAEMAGIGPVTPHVLRHTAATWLMMSGCDIWEAAGFLGMTVRTLETTYGHHRPEHLSGVRGAYRRMRR